MGRRISYPSGQRRLVIYDYISEELTNPADKRTEVMKNHSIFILIIGFAILSSCNQGPGDIVGVQVYDTDPSALIRKSNIVYDSASFQSGAAHVPPYLSNGILGGCFDHMGFQSRANTGNPEGRTVLGYIDSYYEHGPTTRQIQLPLAWITAEFADGSTVMNMMEAEDYRQELDVYHGVLTTEYDLHGKTRITAFASQENPNLFVYRVEREEGVKKLVLSIHCETSAVQNRDFQWKAEPVDLSFEKEGRKVRVISGTNLSETRWVVEADSELSVEGNRIIIPLDEEDNLVRILVERDGSGGEELLERDFDELLSAHREAWEKAWSHSWIDFPDERSASIWTRGQYYNISNFPLSTEKPLIPSGLNSNIWGFTYPQDVYYVMENLLPTGQTERYEAALRYWLDVLPEVRKYSKRIMGVEAGFYPWTPPRTEWDRYERFGVVGHHSYELHNPAYVSAMVWHFYQVTGDREKLVKYFPVMEEVWRFYETILHENEKGKYYVFHPLGAGQDEAHEDLASVNLLCASYSSEYSLENYLKAAEIIGEYDEELYRKAQVIDEAGFERESNLKDNGLLASFVGDERPPNRQKHPVQLNTITFLPMPDNVEEGSPAAKAYDMRYSLTTEALKPVTHGWTYGAFTLASSRMRSEEGFMKDMEAVQYYAGADPRWIQFYEFTFWERWHLKLAYYFPTHGLYQQAYTDAVVQDWRGYTDIFPCILPVWENERLAFKGLRVSGGATVNGSFVDGSFEVELVPGWAKETRLRVSRDIRGITVEGQKEGPGLIDGNQVYDYVFDSVNPIRITYQDE